MTTFQFENKERLPDFPPRSEYETYRMNQLVQIIERRLGSLEESILDIDLANSGFVGGEMYAPLSHLHLESEIQDLGDYIDLSYVQNSLILDDISDVAVNSALPGYLLARDPSNTAWVAVAPGASGGFNPTLVNEDAGDILRYNGFEWVNVIPAAAGFVLRSGDVMDGTLRIPEPYSLQIGDAANRLYWDPITLSVILGSSRDLYLTANFVDINSVSGDTKVRGDAVIVSHSGTETLRTGVNTVEVWDGDSWEDVVLDTRTLDVIGTASETVVDLSGPVDLSADRAWTVGIADDPVFPGTGSATVPSGTTAQEPAGAAGLVRYDSDLGTLRFTTGTTWQTPAYSGGAFHDGFSDFVADEHVAHSGVTVTLTGDTNEIAVGGAAQDIATSLSFSVGIADNPVLPGALSMSVPTGTTAQEPAGAASLIRYDTDLGTLRFTTGTTWRTPAFSGGAFHDGFSDFVSDEHIAHSGVTVTLTGDTNEIAIGGAAQDIAASLSFTVGIADDPVFPGNGSATVPSGTTAQQPTPVNGMLRYDSDTGKLRGVEGGAWTDIVGAGGGATDLDSLTDVTITTPSTGSVLYKSAGDWIDTSAIVIDPAATVDLYHNAVRTFRTKTDGIQVIGTGTASPTTNPGGIQTGQVQLLNANLFPTAYMGHVGSADLTIKNEVHGGQVILSADNTTGSLTSLLQADPDGAASLYYAGDDVLATLAGGALIQPVSGTLAQVDVHATGLNIDASVTARGDTAGIRMYWDESATDARLYQTSATGAIEDIWIEFARNGAVGVYHDGTEKLRTSTTGIEVENTTANAIVKLFDSAGNTGQVVKRSSTGDFRFQNQEDSGWVRLTGSTSASALLDLFTGDPDVGVAFFGSTPIAPPNYTLNTFTTDRNLSSSPSTTELRDVLATLITDLTSYGLLS